MSKLLRIARFGGTRLEDAGMREVGLPVGGLEDAGLRGAGLPVGGLGNAGFREAWLLVGGLENCERQGC